jgi:hypothetical protein
MMNILRVKDSPMTRDLKVLLVLCIYISPGWGFFGHQQINRLAVFCLPVEMSGFYKKNIRYLIETSTHPDERRYAVAAEAPRHFIDLDAYTDTLPKHWSAAVERFGEDSLTTAPRLVTHGGVGSSRCRAMRISKAALSKWRFNRLKWRRR